MEHIRSNEVIKEFNETKNEQKLLINKTKLEKSKFINEIKNGLGEEIKSNPSQITKVKYSFKNKLIKFLNNIFTKF